MRNDWFGSSPVTTFIALGIVATLVSLAVFTVQDCGLLFFNISDGMWMSQRVWYTLLAAVGVLFGLFTLYVWSPAFPRILIGIVTASLASQVAQSVHALPIQSLRWIAICRVCVSLFVAICLYVQFRRMSRSTESAA